jgi:glutaminyl-peptide cyclotransferase
MSNSADGRPRVRPVRRAAALLIALLTVGCGTSTSGGGEHAAKFDPARAFRDLRAQVAFGPRPAGSPANRRDAGLIARKLRKGGVEDVRVQRPYLNVVGRLPGRLPGVVVVGAHYDTKHIAGFVGANDGASGVALLLELARDLPRPLPGPSVDLAFFDAEESRGRSSSARAFARSGDRGSRQYLRYASAGGHQGSPSIHAIRAMVVFDMVADCRLGIPREASSSASLYRLFAGAAQAQRGSAWPFVGRTQTILDDHTPFEGAGIPSVDLIDFDYGPGPPPGRYWHTRADDLEHVCAQSLAAAGRPALAAIPRIR